MKELVEAAPVIAGLIEEGERKAELERQRWEEQMRGYERKRAEERAAKARRESREDILSIVESWAQTRRIEEFFRDAETRLDSLEPERRAELPDRLKRARDLIGGVDALERFCRWKSPSDRLSADADYDDSENCDF